MDKMKIIKNSLIHEMLIGGVVILLITLTVSCKDFLVQNSISNLSTGNYYKNEKQIKGSIVAIYDRLYDSALEFVRVNGFRSDNFKHRQYQEHALSANTFGVWPLQIWGDLYNLIFRCNKTINSLSKVEIDNEDQYEAQAKFVRGYSYFWLVRLYGKLPLVTEKLSKEESLNIPRSPVSDVYAQIEKDLKFAVNNLPTDVHTTGKANKYVAEAILAKVYVMESGYPVNKHKYAMAIPLLEDIIQSGVYKLDESYSSIFTLEGERSSREVMFSAIMDANEKGNQHSVRYFLNPHGLPVRPDVHAEYKKGGDPVAGELWHSFEKGDVRRDVSLDTTGINNLGNRINVINNTKYDYGYVPGIGWTSDYILLRYANILLLYAEAIHATGKSSIIQDPWGIINRIRNRAGLNDISVNQGNFQDILMRERRHEFIWEGERWFDLVRTNTFVEALKKVQHKNAADYWKYLPIPLREMDIMGNVWQQNKGY